MNTQLRKKMNWQTWNSVLWVIEILFVSLGCVLGSFQQTATPARTPTPINTAQWPTYSTAEQGFMISYPDTWERIPMRAADLKMYTDKVSKTNPDQGKALYAFAVRLMNNGARFLAFAVSPLEKDLTSAPMVFIRSGPIQGQELSDFVDLILDGYKDDASLIGNPSKLQVKLPAGNSYRVDYTYKTQAGNIRTGTDYYLLKDNVIHNISFSCREGEAKANAALFAAIAETFKYYP